MKKVIVIMIALILIVGVSGCGSVPAAPAAEVSPTQAAPSEVDIANASNIATAINAYSVLNPSKPPIPDDVTLEDVKEIVGEQQLWPMGISDEEARAAWKLIVIKDGVVDLTLEAQQAMQVATEKPERTITGVTGDAQKKLTYLYASYIATAINAYNALNPEHMLPDDITLEEAKETIGSSLWPSRLSDEDVKEAWKYIVIKDGAANLTPEAKQALDE